MANNEFRVEVVREDAKEQCRVLGCKNVATEYVVEVRDGEDRAYSALCGSHVVYMSLGRKTTPQRVVEHDGHEGSQNCF